MASNFTVADSPSVVEGAEASRRLPALSIIAIGLVLLFVVGFVQAPQVHNGAHDTRHANGVPCH